MSNSRGSFAGLASLLNLPAVARVFWALYRDRRVPLWLKICAAAGVVYIFSPLDVIPDALTGIGVLDDILVSLLMMQSFIDLAPRDVMLEHCQRLSIDPARLHVNVGKALGQALNLAAMLIEGRRASQQAAQVAGAAATNGDASTGPAEAGAEAATEPRYKRYSAFQQEQDNS
jgi:uncharacterized membrane protein YkvA (DUF1232 family)